jgi:tRNA(adenine34) deaminase
MCAKNPGFDLARLFARGNPHLSAQECAAYAVPFPDNGHRAATRAFPAMVPDEPNADGAEISREARAFWQTRWSGKTLMAVGQQDPVLGAEPMKSLEQSIRGCAPPIFLSAAGHFVPEWGLPVASAANALFGS